MPTLQSIVLLTTATATVSSFAIPILPPQSILRLDSNASFQLSIFEDLHFGEAEDTLWGPQQDVNSTRVMNKILDSEPNTHLAVLNGDLITGENTFKENSTKYVDRVVAPLVQRRVVWASTYGNHDSDFKLSRQALFAEESKYPFSLTKNMVSANDSGVSNYYLPVYGDNSSIPEFLLWFFDSRGGYHYQQKSASGDRVGIPDWVSQSVVDWFTSTRDSLQDKYNRSVPSVAFVHIPVNAMSAFQSTGVDAHKEPGINDDNPLAPQGTAAGEDVPFMKALLETQGLRAVFSGHDHGDDWCFKWDSQLPDIKLNGTGVNFCFGRHSGYGGYGTWTRGSRQVVLQKGRDEVETWIRLEDGSISGKVTLNATYGQDSYPVVDG